MARSFSRGDWGAAFAQITELGQMLQQRRDEKERIRLANEANQRAAADQNFQMAERERELPYRQEATRAGYDSPGQYRSALDRDVLERKKQADEDAARTARAGYLQSKVGSGTLTEQQAFDISRGLSSDLNEGTVMSLEKPPEQGKYEKLRAYQNHPDPVIREWANREAAAIGDKAAAPPVTLEQEVESAVLKGLAKLLAEPIIAQKTAAAAPPVAKLDYPVAEDPLVEMLRQNRAEPAPFNVEMVQPDPSKFMPEAQRVVPGPDTKAPKVDTQAAAIEQRSRDWVQTMADQLFDPGVAVTPTQKLREIAGRIARAKNEAEKKAIMAPYMDRTGLKLDRAKLATLFDVAQTSQ